MNPATAGLSPGHDGPAGIAGDNSGAVASMSSDSPQPQAQAATAPQPSRARKPCRFYGSKTGCRAGSACPFLHDGSQLPASSHPGGGSHQASTTRSAKPETSTAGSSTAQRRRQQRPKPASSTATASPAERQYTPRAVESTRVVPRPTPRAQLDDPREFQLGQIRRRYGPVTEREVDGDDAALASAGGARGGAKATVLTFKMAPSDPDFPYDISALECALRVPAAYLAAPDAVLSLGVGNKEMGRGYQINVERGFDELARTSDGATLLRLMNALDQRLESLLGAEKAETVKIVANAGQKRPQKTFPQQPSQHIAETEVLTASRSIPSPPSYSPEQKVGAASTREAETRQIEARLGRLAQFSKGHDGISYTIPVEPRKRSELPLAVQAVKTTKLLVPFLYNLEPCTIEMVGVDRDAAATVEKAFKERAAKNPQMSLLNHINYLTQNMHTMATQDIEQDTLPEMEELAIDEPVTTQQTERGTTGSQPVGSADEDRPHLILIPRPPEWTVPDESDGDTDDSSLDNSDEQSDIDEAGSGDEKGFSAPAATPERGIMLSFPHLELYSIELLELTLLNITVKCERCKDTTDVANLKNNTAGDASGMKSESCKKCANSLGVGYRMDLIHANSVRAGYLDLDGCTVVDLLPSTFIPTCAECSTPHTSPGVVSVRGEASMAICRHCHRKMTFKIPEVKFLLVSATALRASRALPRKKPKEKLGIVAGTELPKRGRCKHYAKSYRWFRFSCCSKVFSCDRCHDEASDHPNEHANRMICGYCSREQNYRPEDCGICHSALTGKRGTGFWEGGKGTRDKTRMSRKDPRKFKRRPGTTHGASKK